jgi:hypothetical protein
MIGRMYNNFGICSTAIGICLAESQKMKVSSALLIMPIISNQELLSYISNARTNFESIEQLIIRKPICFANFNARFYDSLSVTINAIQFLNETNYIKLENESLLSIKKMDFHKDMGNRAYKIYKARMNINKLIQTDLSSIYRNLRIEL